MIIKKVSGAFFILNIMKRGLKAPNLVLNNVLSISLLGYAGDTARSWKSKDSLLRELKGPLRSKKEELSLGIDFSVWPVVSLYK